MLRNENLLRMADVRDEWCVSIYMPIDQDDPQKGRGRLKKLVFEAEDKLLALGSSPVKVTRILGPIEMIAENAAFWNEPREGFVAFFTADSFVWTSMLYKPDELVVVTDRFHLKPLLRNDGRGGRFYLVSMIGDQVAFFEASKAGINQLFPKRMPRNIDSKLLHAEVSPAGGIEDNKNGRKADLLEFLGRVDSSINEYLNGEGAPLVLAAPEHLHPLYREINTYPALLKEGVKVSGDQMGPGDLLKNALLIARPAFRKKREKALETFREKLGTGLTLDKFPEIFKAAKEGRVDTLFVPVGIQQWGIFNSRTGETEIHELTKPGDKDLLCVASTKTLQKGGKVFVVLPEQMPNNAPAAAILKY